ncbi:MAG: T9SS type A sorting domain-containing protein, partial [Bacteroidota bacterium]
PTLVSGLLTIPFDADEPNLAYPLLVYNHGTAGTREGVPSRVGNGERLLTDIVGSQGYITLAPDYLGLGDDNTAIHPYVHAASEAAAGRTMIAAVKSWLDQEAIGYTEQLFVTGYSQGGHASAALHLDIQENPGADNLNVTAAAHMSGPYSISEVMKNIVVNNTGTTFPGYLAYTYISYNEVYGVYDDLGAVFVEPYLSPIRAFAAGATELFEVNASLENLIAQEGATLQDIFQDSIITILETENDHPLNAALRDNDVYRFAPTSPTSLTYCTADEQVPFRNAILADSVMQALGSQSVQLVSPGALDHGGCVEPAVTFMLILFNTFAEVVSSVRERELPQLALYPNPIASGQRRLLLEGELATLEYKIISQNGNVVFRGEKPSGQNHLALPQLPSGIYFLKAQTDQQQYLNKIIIH